MHDVTCSSQTSRGLKEKDVDSIYTHVDYMKENETKHEKMTSNTSNYCEFDSILSIKKYFFLLLSTLMNDPLRAFKMSLKMRANYEN